MSANFDWLKRPSTLIVEETPTGCPACGCPRIEELRLSPLDHALKRTAKIRCIKCGVATLVAPLSSVSEGVPTVAQNEAMPDDERTYTHGWDEEEYLAEPAADQHGSEREYETHESESELPELEILSVEYQAQRRYQWACKYMAGDGVDEDPRAAYVLFLKAAETGHLKAQYNLGVLMLKGLGTHKNISEARQWLRKAAANGHQKAAALIPRLEQMQAQ